MSFSILGLTTNVDFVPVLESVSGTLVEVTLNLLVSYRPTVLIVTVLNPKLILDTVSTQLHPKYANYQMSFNLLPHHSVNSD